MTTKKQTTITVAIPKIKLRIEDLAYMQQLQNNIACHCKSNQKERLTFLGLIEEREMEPTKKQMDAYRESYAQKKADTKEALRLEDWDRVVYNAKYISWERDKPKKEKRMCLTAAGESLLKKGIAQSKTTTKGVCL